MVSNAKRRRVKKQNAKAKDNVVAATVTDDENHAKTDDELKTDNTTDVKTDNTTDVKTDNTTDVKTDNTTDVKTDSENHVNTIRIQVKTDCEQYDNQKYEDSRRRKNERKNSESIEEPRRKNSESIEEQRRKNSESSEEQRRKYYESNEEPESNKEPESDEEPRTKYKQTEPEPTEKKKRKKRTPEYPETETSLELIPELLMSFNKIFMTMQMSPSTLMSVVDGEVKRINKILTRTMLDGSLLKSLTNNPFDSANMFPKFISILTSGSPLSEQTSMISGLFGAANPLFSMFTTMLQRR